MSGKTSGGHEQPSGLGADADLAVIGCGSPGKSLAGLVHRRDHAGEVAGLKGEGLWVRVAWEGPRAGVQLGRRRQGVHRARSPTSASAGEMVPRVSVVMRYHARAACSQAARACAAVSAYSDSRAPLRCSCAAPHGRPGSGAGSRSCG